MEFQIGVRSDRHNLCYSGVCISENNINVDILRSYRNQWPRGLKRGSTAARLVRLWARILPGAWTSVSCDCCVLYR